MTGWFAVLTAVVVWSVESRERTCKFGQEYWSNHQQKCFRCSVCSTDEIVVRPCHVHKDTQCRLLSSVVGHSVSTPSSTWTAEKMSSPSIDLTQTKYDPYVVDEPLSFVESVTWDWEIGVLVAAVVGLFLLICTVGYFITVRCVRKYCKRRNGVKGCLSCEDDYSRSQNGFHMDSLLERNSEEDVRYH